MDVDDGVTPFLTTCPTHGVYAESSFYPPTVVMHPSLWPVQLVWRRATASERKRERREHGNHYAQGGLALETTGAKPPDQPSWRTTGRHG